MMFFFSFHAPPCERLDRVRAGEFASPVEHR